LKKNESGGNQFDVTISSQEDFRNVVVKKMHSTHVHFASKMPGIITENPTEVL
jgi:isopentenyl phosphate kinase